MLRTLYRSTLFVLSMLVVSVVTFLGTRYYDFQQAKIDNSRQIALLEAQKTAEVKQVLARLDRPQAGPQEVTTLYESAQLPAVKNER